MANLKSLYQSVLNSRFPQAPNDDLLNDIFADLVLLDSGYIGLTSSYMSGSSIELKDISDIEKLEKRISEFDKDVLKESDLRLYKDLHNYISALYNLALELKNSLKKNRAYKE